MTFVIGCYLYNEMGESEDSDQWGIHTRDNDAKGRAYGTCATTRLRGRVSVTWAPFVVAFAERSQSSAVMRGSCISRQTLRGAQMFAAGLSA